MNEPWRLPVEFVEKKWKARNAAVEAAMRAYLATVPQGILVSTRDLTAAIAPTRGYVRTMPISGPQSQSRVGLESAVASILGKLAPWMGELLASHDGPEFEAMGKKFRRWQWHGQQTENA